MNLDRYRTPAWSWLTGPIRAQLDEAPNRQTVTVDFSTLPTEAADRYADLLGQRARPTGRTRVNLARVDEALRATPAGLPLVALLVGLGGPLENRRERRADTRSALANVWTSVQGHPALIRHPELLAWLGNEKAQSSRLPGDAQRRLEILNAALDVTEALPATGIGRARLSWQVLRDTKALSATAADQHQRACVIRVVAALAGRDIPPARRRNASCGKRSGSPSIRCQAGYSSPVSHPAVTPPFPTRLRLKTSAGLASVLTLADVDAWASAGIFGLPAQVFICENPEVTVAALNQFGTSCPALICTEGRPHLTAVRLISALIDVGVSAGIHADFDWDGLSITGTITRRGAEPWRMSAQDYVAAATAAAVHDRPLPKLTGSSVPTPWSPELERVILEREVEVHEEDEGVLTALLSDLSEARDRSARLPSHTAHSL